MDLIETAFVEHRRLAIPISDGPPANIDAAIYDGSKTTGLHRQRPDIQVRAAEHALAARDSGGVSRVKTGVADCENVIYYWKNTGTFQDYFLQCQVVYFCTDATRFCELEVLVAFVASVEGHLTEDHLFGMSCPVQVLTDLRIDEIRKSIALRLYNAFR